MIHISKYSSFEALKGIKVACCEATKKYLWSIIFGMFIFILSILIYPSNKRVILFIYFLIFMKCFKYLYPSNKGVYQFDPVLMQVFFFFYLTVIFSILENGVDLDIISTL